MGNVQGARWCNPFTGVYTGINPNDFLVRFSVVPKADFHQIDSSLLGTLADHFQLHSVRIPFGQLLCKQVDLQEGSG